MNTKLIVGLLVVVAGLGLGWYVLKGSYQPSTTPTEEVGAPSPSTREETTVTLTIPPFPETTGGTDKGGVGAEMTGKGTFVTYTDSGYTPSTITVKLGTKLTWVNQSSSGMWTASALHPTHMLLPGFDELKSVAKGGSYDYTFTKVGTWKYHNHVQPSDTGTVVVTE